MSYTPEVENAATQWLAKHRATDDPKVVSMIVNRAQEICAELGGYFSVAHCERAYLELVNEKKIQPFRGSVESKLEAESAPIPKEVADYIERTGSRELARRYNSDAAFRAQYDRHEKLKASPQQVQAGEDSWTVEEYYKIPAREMQARLRNPRYKLRLMQKIKSGEIR